MTAHFFDLSSLIRVDSMVWLVSRIKPSIPILKITQSDFNLIKKGVFQNSGNRLKIGGNDYWVTQEMLELIKLKCRKSGVEISDLAFSLQEFMNPDIIEKLDYEIYEMNFEHLKNTKDDIYIICSKNTKNNSSGIIKKLEEKLSELGLTVKNYYFISETFFNRNDDDISFKKTRLILQHLIGLKTEGDKFKDEEITKYDRVFVYENSKRTLHELKIISDTLDFLKSKSSEDIQSKISDRLSQNPLLILNEITFNRVNRFITTQINLLNSRILKTYESFRKKL